MREFITMAIEEFEEKLEQLTNGNITVIYNENGYEYVSEKENAETNNVSIKEINKIISDGLGIKVYKIQIDTDSGKVTIIMK